MKSLIKSLLPRKITSAMDMRAEIKSLARLERSECNTKNLRADIPGFRDLNLQNEWSGVLEKQNKLGMNDMSGAVNPGDRRAIYYLARALNPTSVLEVGTHLGASTSMLALALKQSGNPAVKFTTCDILDVNGPNGTWSRLGAKYSPKSLVEALDCNFVNFVTSPSVPFMRSCTDRFDLIFLDGGHEAETVYKEVPAALNLLHPGGLILLHDVYPNCQPLWSDGYVCPGPWLAVERFRNEGAKVQVKPLGELPWPTKLGSNVTSLACMVSASN